MKQEILEIKQNKKLAENVFEIKLSGGDFKEIRPGQFVNIKLEGLYLRRPISVCDVNLDEDLEGRLSASIRLNKENSAKVGTVNCGNHVFEQANVSGDELTIIFKVVGKGTEALSKMQPGEKLDVLTGLGNGYDLSASGDEPLLIGGGVGVPPMYYLAKKLIAAGKNVSVVMGFNRQDEIFYEDEFKKLGCKVTVATADGNYGIKGFVTDALPENYSYVYTCGPEPMLKAVYRAIKTGGQFSFEERMGCGFGACMGCSCKTITGYKRICKDGPVMLKEEILWE